MKTKTKPKKMKSVDIEPTMLEALADPEIATEYVRDCLSESGEHRSKLLLKALMNVAKAQGISNLAKGSESRRRTIYKTLSEDSNPTISTLESILEDMGLMIDVKPIKKAGGW